MQKYKKSYEYFHNSSFNYGEFAIIKSQIDLNSYKIRVKNESIKLMLLVLLYKILLLEMKLLKNVEKYVMKLLTIIIKCHYNY